MEKTFVKCRECGRIADIFSVRAGDYICPFCGAYFAMPAHERIRSICDEGSFEEKFTDIPFENVIMFDGYEEKHEAERKRSGISEGVITGTARIGGLPVAIGIMDTRFMMGSMGRIVGERITRLFELAADEGLPLIMFTASGGARMQEGIVSLMQMVKTMGGVSRLHDAGCLYIDVLTNPTSGGVTASFAMAGDIILAEPNALVCFAGPRVVYQTIKKKLPPGFQRAEDVLEHGFIDGIVSRGELRERLIYFLRFFARKDGGSND